jgi:hypothetical protein
LTAARKHDVCKLQRRRIKGLLKLVQSAQLQRSQGEGMMKNYRSLRLASAFATGFTAARVMRKHVLAAILACFAYSIVAYAQQLPQDRSVTPSAGATFGQTEVVCENSVVPAGWSIIGFSSSISCDAIGFAANNAITIENLSALRSVKK